MINDHALGKFIGKKSDAGRPTASPISQSLSVETKSYREGPAGNWSGGITLSPGQAKNKKVLQQYYFKDVFSFIHN